MLGYQSLGKPPSIQFCILLSSKYTLPNLFMLTCAERCPQTLQLFPAQWFNFFKKCHKYLREGQKTFKIFFLVLTALILVYTTVIQINAEMLEVPQISEGDGEALFWNVHQDFPSCNGIIICFLPCEIKLSSIVSHNDYRQSWSTSKVYQFSQIERQNLTPGGSAS